MTLTATSARERLLQRATELQHLLKDSLHQAVEAPGQPGDVTDFKELAQAEAAVAVRGVALAHAATELRQVAAALRRIAAGEWGFCESCGEPIASARLEALPHTALCTDCQAVSEHARPVAAQ